MRVVSSVVDPVAQADLLVAAYPLDRPIACDLVSQSINDTYRVQAGDAISFARLGRRGWLDRAALEAEAHIVLAAHAAGIGVALPIRRRDDGFATKIDCPEGTRLLMLFTSAGETADDRLTSARSRSYGELAAKLHGILDDLGDDLARPVLDERLLIDEPLAAILPVATRLGFDPNELADIAARTKEALAGLTRSPDHFGLIHGDLHSGNVRFGGNGSLTLFDFDCCAYGWRTYDLAVFIWNSYLERRSKSWRAQHWRAFLTGYRRERALDDADLAAVSSFLAARHLWLIGLDCRGASGYPPQFMGRSYGPTMMGFLDQMLADFSPVS